MGLLLDYSPRPCRAQCTWREIPLLWMSVKGDSCLDSGEKRGVFMYVKRRLCEQGGEDAAWPCGNLVRLSEQPSDWGAYCLLGVKEGIERCLARKKPPLELRKRAIKHGTSWYSEKLCENNSVSTQLLASDFPTGQMGICLRRPTADLWPQRLGNHDSCR